MESYLCITLMIKVINLADFTPDLCLFHQPLKLHFWTKASLVDLSVFFCIQKLVY